jgi:hypothetical protein
MTRKSQHACGTMELYTHNINQIRNYLSLLFSLPIASANTFFGQEHHGTDRQAHRYRGTQEATRIMLASIQGIHTLFFYFFLLKGESNMIQKQKGWREMGAFRIARITYVPFIRVCRT